ncbi:hypothetical protein SB48_HM08orf02939 [Heyndrickxia coagulans]|uniref:Uncharacterized protein n=1 Tax=Heyndrickxia coagulans TaxID=1398 RepID=A0AAN0T7T3_HEYCO|nr:hypothetical protein SB48_HM08orf02939 [Heyndrickxia coagulans]
MRVILNFRKTLPPFCAKRGRAFLQCAGNPFFIQMIEFSPPVIV